MKLSLDYNRPKSEGQVSDAELSVDYISYAVSQKYPQGLEGQLRRVWGRIQRKFDKAIEYKADEIELEEAEKDFIIKAFNECKYPANTAKYVDTLEIEIDTLKTAKA